jgi:hypothetical protein
MDFLLAVGDCQNMYTRHHVMRSMGAIEEMGYADKVDSKFFTYFVPGHDVELEAIEKGFAELKARAAEWAEKKVELGIDA